MILKRFNHRKSYFETDPGSSPGKRWTCHGTRWVNCTWGNLIVVKRTLPFKPHLGRSIFNYRTVPLSKSSFLTFQIQFFRKIIEFIKNRIFKFIFINKCRFTCGMNKNLKTYHHVMRALFCFSTTGYQLHTFIFRVWVVIILSWFMKFFPISSR